MAPPGSTIALALVPPSEGQTNAVGETRCSLSTDDIQAVYDLLKSRGVEVDAEIGRAGTSRPGLISTQASISDPMPPQFSFRDPDGNRFLIVEQPRDDLYQIGMASILQNRRQGANTPLHGDKNARISRYV